MNVCSSIADGTTFSTTARFVFVGGVVSMLLYSTSASTSTLVPLGNNHLILFFYCFLQLLCVQVKPPVISSAALQQRFVALECYYICENHRSNKHFHTQYKHQTRMFHLQR